MTNAKGKSRARAVADVGQGTILATVEIAAPLERVFRALTSSDEVVRWWGSDELYRTTEWTADLRVGGRWQARGKAADGTEFVVGGEYRELDPPHKIVQTWKSDWDPEQVTTLTYRLDPIADGTRVTVRHEGFAGRPESCLEHTRGWEHVLDWLVAFAVPASAPKACQYFLCRLLPPRPTFPADMTPDEAKIMHEHVAYWIGHLHAGRAVVFGPVLDPKGAWGLGVVQVEDPAELAALQANDPAIRSGIGFGYEAYPMPKAIARE